MTGTAVLVVDRLGRRPLLLGGVSGMVNKGCPVSQFFCYLLFFFLFQGCTCKNAKENMRFWGLADEPNYW
jgi:hypothetical protein